VTRIVFVSGPYRGDVAANIAKARELAVRIWQAGDIAVCPHTNSALMDGLASDEAFLSGYLELLKRCDCIALVEGWEKSEGSRAEVALANELGMERWG